MTFVIDASVTLTWYFPDEATEATEAILDRVARSGALAPPIWRVEVANILQIGMRRKRIDGPYRDAAFADLSRLPIVIDSQSDSYLWTRTLELSDKFALTIYDACYLELADRHNLPLASLDKQLCRAAEACGLNILRL